MKRTWTIIGVIDVPGSFKWYQALFGQPETPPGHDHFGQILDTDGNVLLCLPQWGAQEHSSLMMNDDIEIRQSTISGRGVFAPRQFRKGETVLRWDVSRK